MLLDWLLYGLLVFRIAKLLNGTVFTSKTASGFAFIPWGSVDANLLQ